MRQGGRGVHRGLVQSVLFYGAFLLVAAVLSSVAQLPSLFTPPATVERGAISIGLAVVLSLVVVLGGQSLESREWYARMATVVRDVVRQLLGPRPALADIFIVALSSALGEECLFRGFLQPWFVRFASQRLPEGSLLGPLFGVGLASLLFAAVHPPVHRDLRPWTVFALAMGLAWGLLAFWSGSIAAPLLGHFLVNFLNLRRLGADPGPVAPVR